MNHPLMRGTISVSLVLAAFGQAQANLPIRQMQRLPRHLRSPTAPKGRARYAGVQRRPVQLIPIRYLPIKFIPEEILS